MRKLTVLPALIAIGCLVAVAVWWFTQWSLLPATDAAAAQDISQRAMRLTLLLQLMSISLLAPLWANRPSESLAGHLTTSIFPALFPAWPLLTIFWMATGVSAVALTATEASILAAGWVVILLARAIRQLVPRAEINRLMQASLGLVATATVWLFRVEWLQWIEP
ncbi:MAG: hypothetical protein GXP15_03730 [Gammaproteobacteria bacterium]|nr:hypothetical protein [Gammaproteobacteria bacterium]